MVTILFDETRVSVTDLEQYTALILKILNDELRTPDVKDVKGSTYHGEKIYRARINLKDRLYYTFCKDRETKEKRLMILNINNHNYKQVERQLQHNPRINGAEYTIPTQSSKLQDHTSSGTDIKITWEGVVSYNQKLLRFDETQQLGMSQQAPLILQGPPGTGKTAILWNRMKRELAAQSASETPDTNPTIRPQIAKNVFMTQSPHLVKTLKAELEADLLHKVHPVDITTWLDFSQHLNPGLTAATPEQFAKWLRESRFEDPADIIHYELSLIAALGSELYLEQEARQCYFPKQPEKQNQLIKLLKSWNSYLQEHRLFDPNVTITQITDLVFNNVFMDEIQNQPPVAQRFFIEHTPKEGLAVCIDDEQALISSPFIHSSLKQLLHKYYGHYFEQPLPRTWRCPPAVVNAANQLLAKKYELDGKGKRRAYTRIESVHPKGGLASFVDTKNLSSLKTFTASAETLVISEHITPEESRQINSKLNTANILSAREAIGLDFKLVILWKPFSENKCLRELAQAMKKTRVPGLTLEQWNALNALYVAISRAESTLLIYEPDSHWQEICELFLGPLLKNVMPVDLETKDTPEQVRSNWLKTVEHHVNEGQLDIARKLMAFHLHMDHHQIEEFIAERKPAAVIPTAPIVEHEPLKAQASASKGVKKSARASSAVRAIPEVKKSLSVQERKEEFVANLLANPSRKNLQTIMDSDSCLKYLFKYASNGDVMFTLLLERLSPSFNETSVAALAAKQGDEEHFIKLLCLLLSKPDLFNFFTTEYLNKPMARSPLITPLYLLSKYDGIGYFLYMSCQKNKDFMKGISYDALFNSSCIKEADGKTTAPTESAFFYFSRNEYGLAFLECVLERNPGLVARLTSQFVSQQRAERANGILNNLMAGKSILYNLCSHESGRRILNKLALTNPELIANLEASIILKGVFNKGDHELLLKLLQCESGCELLQTLIEKNPQFAKQFTPFVLTQLKSRKLAILQSTLLSYLLSYDKGHCILKEFLAKEPELLAPYSSLLMHCIIEEQALTWLCNTPDGIIVLLHIFYRNRDQLNKIPAKDIFSPTTISNYTIICAFNHLVSCHAGAKVLAQLTDVNPEIAEKTLANLLSIWFTESTTDDFALKHNSLRIFASDIEARALLNTLFKRFPEITKIVIHGQFLADRNAVLRLVYVKNFILNDPSGFLFLSIIMSHMPSLFDLVKSLISGKEIALFEACVRKAHSLTMVTNLEIEAAQEEAEAKLDDQMDKATLPLRNFSIFPQSKEKDTNSSQQSPSPN